MPYLIWTIEMFICAIVQNCSDDAKNLKNGFSREWRIQIKKIVINQQILPWFYVLLKVWIKMVKKVNPVMKISLYKKKKSYESSTSKQMCDLPKTTAQNYLIKLPNKTLQRFFYLLKWNWSNTINETSNFGRLKPINKKVIHTLFQLIYQYDHLILKLKWQTTKKYILKLIKHITLHIKHWNWFPADK